jgi:hypothetical protein
VFEPETYVQATAKMKCIPECGYEAPTDVWIVAGNRSARKPSGIVALYAAYARNIRLGHVRRKNQTFAGGLCF